MSGADPNSLIKNLVARQFDELLAEVQRARGVVGDAIPSILKAFREIQEQVTDQVTTLKGLTDQMGDDGQTGFLNTMRGVVDTFVKDLVTISSQSMRIVERVNLMSGDVELVIGNVANIEEMASTTRFIALNAHIEAHRSGSAGAAFRVVAEEVKHLAGDAQNFSGQIRGAVERFHSRLDDTRSLVSTLASHDLNGALSAQSRMMETVDGIRRTNEGLLVTLKVLDGTVHGAIQALQFEDILNQLLVSIQDRLTLLRSVFLETLEAENHDEVTEVIERNRSLFEKRSSVTQSSISSGTVDLF